MGKYLEKLNYTTNIPLHKSFFLHIFDGEKMEDIGNIEDILSVLDEKNENTLQIDFVKKLYEGDLNAIFEFIRVLKIREMKLDNEMHDENLFEKLGIPLNWNASPFDFIMKFLSQMDKNLQLFTVAELFFQNDLTKWIAVYAALNGNEELTKRCTDNKNLHQSDLHSAIAHSLRKQQFKVYKLFLESHPLYSEQEMFELLLDAVISGNLEFVKYLVKIGFTLNHENSHAFVAQSLYSENTKVVKFLVKKGINLHSMGNLCLWYAIFLHDSKSLKYYAKKLGTVNCTNYDERTYNLLSKALMENFTYGVIFLLRKNVYIYPAYPDTMGLSNQNIIKRKIYSPKGKYGWEILN